MKIRIYDEPFGRDGQPIIWFSHCSCSLKPFLNKRTGLHIYLFKKLFYIDFENKCKDCDAPF